MAGKPQSREALATWLLAAGGRPDEALALARLGLSTSTWAGLPRSIARGDWSALADWAPARQLDLLHKICHDLMVVASGGLPRFFPPADLPPPPRLSALLQWQKALQQAARTVEHPFNSGLQQEAWAGLARSVLTPN